ncbi:MAG: polymer-forming cytoskeletal protein [Oscillospiraceae bacterium]|nr:polymer-forming cytoskeletal protein [Oscillospiraceae bacterium]
MGFFGMQKAEQMVEPPAAEERFEEKPALPRANSTVIAQGVTVKGTLRGEGVVQVEGVVEGEFDLTGAVIVAESGLIRGPIKADVVRVAGRVEGSVYAREHMRLEPTGSLDGDVTTASLVVEDGGILNGRCTTTKLPVPELELQRVKGSTALEFGPEFDLEEEK